MKNSTLEYYMAQDYPIEIRAIPSDMGGGYSASIPHLGRMAFFAVGDTIPEALTALDEVKEVMFEDMISRGKSIPAPPPLPEEENDVYSGRVLLRMPRELHRDLSEHAENEGCSLNQYISAALARHIGGIQAFEAMAHSVTASLVCKAPFTESVACYNTSPGTDKTGTLDDLARKYAASTGESYPQLMAS